MQNAEKATGGTGKPGGWKVVLLAIAGLLLVAFIILFGWDDRLDAAVDLQPRRPVLKDNSANGFIQLTAKWLKYPEPDSTKINKVSDMIAGGKAWDQSAVDALDLARIPFAADLEQALAMRDWQIQSVLPDGGIETESVLCQFKKCRLAGFRVATEFRENRPEEAFVLWDRLLTAQQRSFAGSTCLVDGFIALGIMKLTAQTALDAACLPAEQLTDGILSKLQSRLLDVQITWEDVSEVLRHEAASSVGAFQKFKREGPSPEFRDVFPDKAESKKFAQYL